MSKTVHPYAFRIGVIRGWKSRWFNVKKYRHFLKTDVLIREWLEKKLRGMYIESIDMERSPNIFHLIIKTSRPGLLIGRKGEGSEKLKSEIKKKLEKIKAEIPREIKLTVEEVRSPEMRAKIVSQMVAENLEKRMPFRRIMKQMMEKVMANKEVEGAKIALSGRLGGTEMSRREWLKKGRIPLQTLRANVDFARERAHLPYGDIGIKVWIYRGELLK
ncbi:MAG TPA: 30S ribosomal protein S3 [bacterium]|nr:30S ribosomal protein S3 [bacterium]